MNINTNPVTNILNPITPSQNERKRVIDGQDVVIETNTTSSQTNPSPKPHEGGQ